MKKYKVGEIFGLDSEYAQRAKFCNENGLLIAEINKDSNGERRFQICELPKPTKEQLLSAEISEKKELLNKYREDVEQVDLFGIERADYTEKKKACKELVLELRKLEKERGNVNN